MTPEKTAVETSFSAYISSCLRVALRYADKLVADTPADDFAHMPHPNMNHPAFCIGHLAMYPNRVLAMVDRGDAIVEKPGYAELFDAPTPCVEQDGRYPAKDEIVAWFVDRHNAVADILPDVTDETLAQPLEGPYSKLSPTVGGAVNFMLASHTMLHLGQISAWRRAMGLPPAM